MNRQQRQLQNLLRLARRARAQSRPAVPATLDPRALAELTRAATRRASALKPETPPSAAWWNFLERASWWTAGAAVATCVALLVARHALAPEPDATALLLGWPAQTAEPF